MFEILKFLPEVPPTLYEQLDSLILERLVELHPNATLQQLCEVVKKERGSLKPSISFQGKSMASLASGEIFLAISTAARKNCPARINDTS